MSPGAVRYVAAVLIVVLTTSCGSSFESMRPDELVTVVSHSSQATAPRQSSHEWSGRFEELDEVLTVAIPYAPRPRQVGEVTQEEFKRFMLRALRDVDFRKLKARVDPPAYQVMAASWWGTQVEQKDIDITRGYQAWCEQDGNAGSCIDLSPSAPYLVGFQKYRVALGIGVSRFVDGFVDELGNEARALVDPDTLKFMLIGAMVSYLVLLANPDPVFTKALAAAATVVMTAMLGARTVCDVVFGFRDMITEVDAARTFDAVSTAGKRYGRKVGVATARIVVMAMMALLSEGGTVGRLLSFPKLPQASAVLLAETGGALSVQSIRQVAGVTVLKGGVYVAMVEAGDTVSGDVATVTSPVPVTAPAPGPTSQVQLPPGVVGYKSFGALKNVIGVAPPGSNGTTLSSNAKRSSSGRKLSIIAGMSSCWTRRPI